MGCAGSKKDDQEERIAELQKEHAKEKAEHAKEKAEHAKEKAELLERIMNIEAAFEAKLAAVLPAPAASPAADPPTDEAAAGDGEPVELGDQIGNGNFSFVFKGTLGGNAIAVKVLKLASKEALERFHKEFKMHQAVSCDPEFAQRSGTDANSIDENDNIVRVKFLTTIMYRNSPVEGIVMELCDTTVEALLEKHPGGSSPGLNYYAIRLPICRGATAGVVHLHRKGYIHRDIKPANILISWRTINHGTRTPIAKISDLGLSRECVEDTTMSYAGTPLFAAPEVLRRERYNQKADSWSLGTVCLSLCKLRTSPYDGQPGAGPDGIPLSHAIAEGRIVPWVSPNSPLRVPLQRCFNRDPDERPSSEELYEMLMEKKVNTAAFDLGSNPPSPAAPAASPASSGKAASPAAASSATRQLDYPSTETAGAADQAAPPPSPMGDPTSPLPQRNETGPNDTGTN